MDYIKLLHETGLTEREAKAYMSILYLGQTTIGKIIEKTNIPSSKIYEILNRLEEKGLITHIIIKNKKNFQASNPEIIIEQLERKTNKFREHLKELQEIQKLEQEEQFAEFYEGREAIFNMLRNITKNAKKGDEYRYFAFDDEYKEKSLASALSSITILQKEKGLKIMTLGTQKSKHILESTIPKAAYKAMNIKYTTNRYPEGIIILGDDLILIELVGTPSAVKLHCRTFAENHKRYFDEEYKRSK